MNVVLHRANLLVLLIFHSVSNFITERSCADDPCLNRKRSLPELPPKPTIDDPPYRKRIDDE